MDVLLEGGAVLMERDYTLIIDKSQGMSSLEGSSRQSRWEIVQESTLALITQCEQFDLDGITLYFFSDEFKRYDHVTSGFVSQIFQQNPPVGKANLAAVLKDAIDHYLGRRATQTAKPNGETIVVVTAGEIENPQAVKQIIIAAANQLERDEELAISLIQVGSNPKVTEFFQILDKELQALGAKFDICNTVTLTEMEKMALTDVLLNAIVD